MLNLTSGCRPFGRTGLLIPPVTFGTSCLGNLYHAIPEETKDLIVSEAVSLGAGPVWFDSAGKYGAGLALEVLGRSLARAGCASSDIVISNKLGWYRKELTYSVPTFEPGVWVGIEHDATALISYDGILKCYEQGCDLLGGKFRPQVVSVHDPDEYLAAARGPADRDTRWQNIIGAYRALFELKSRGYVSAVGVGAKQWQVVRQIADEVDLDWVMFACSLTIYSHPRELLAFIDDLNVRGVGIINSAVFNSGFLVGGPIFNYRCPEPGRDGELFRWRERFLAVCQRFSVSAASVCVQFSLSVSGVASVALNAGTPEQVRENIASSTARIPSALWRAMKDERLVDRDFPLPG